eukprot:jgi/Ulvmu1/2890/UM146_0032.1
MSTGLWGMNPRQPRHGESRSEIWELWGGGSKQGVGLSGRTCRVAGPMWLGPLHDTAFVQAMQQQAEQRGWTGHAFTDSTGVKLTGHNPPKPLERLLELLLAESEPELPPWCTLLSDVKACCGLLQIPRRDDLIEALRSEGFVACATHMESRAIKTSATIAQMRSVLQQSAGGAGHSGVEGES